MFWWYILFNIVSLVFLIIATYYSTKAATAAHDKNTNDAHKNAMITALITGITAGVILLVFILVMVYGIKKQTTWSPQAHYAAMRAAGDTYAAMRAAYTPQPPAQ